MLVFPNEWSKFIVEKMWNKKQYSDYSLQTIIRFAILLAVIFLTAFCPTLQAQNLQNPIGIAVEADGNILVTDSESNTLYRIDRVSGTFTVLSDESTGNGPAFISPSDVAVEADGNILVNSFTQGIVYRVDPDSGDRSILSDDYNGNGTNFRNCAGIAVEADGKILITDSNFNRVFRVDPITGDRTEIADFFTGNGPDILLPYGIAVEADGNIIMVNDLKYLIRIHPTTLERTIVSDANTGSGPELSRPFGVTIGTDGFIYASDKNENAIFRIDPETGDRTIFSTCPSIDPAVSDLLYLATEADGNLVVVDQIIDEVIRVNPVNGDCSYVKDGPTSLNPPDFLQLGHIQIAPNPFGSYTQINFEAPASGEIQILIFNMLGQPVRTLMQAFIAEGPQSIQWDGQDNLGQRLPSGNYLVNITAKKYSGSFKITRIAY